MGTIDSLSNIQIILIIVIPLLILLFSISILIHNSTKRKCTEIINSSGMSAGEILSVISRNSDKPINLESLQNRQLNSPIIYNIILCLQSALENYLNTFQKILSNLIIITSIVGYTLILLAIGLDRTELLVYGIGSFYIGLGFLVIKILSLMAKADGLLDLLKKYHICDESDVNYYRNYLYTECLVEGKNLFIILYYIVKFLDPFPAVNMVRNQDQD